MEKNGLEIIAAEIMKDFPRSKLSVSNGSLFRSHIRRFGDQIDEPIIADEKDAPSHFLRVSIPISESTSGDFFTVALSPKAAEKLLSRA